MSIFLNELSIGRKLFQASYLKMTKIKNENLAISWLLCVQRKSVSYLSVAGTNPSWKLYPDARKLLLNSKSRGRIRRTLRTSRYSKSYNFGMLLILELINYISLSSSLRLFSISLADFSCLSLYVSRVRTMVLSDVSSSSCI